MANRHEGLPIAGLPPPFMAAPLKLSGRMATKEIDADNFREHFDKETIEYVGEDTRLSTLQRKLVRENNPQVSHALACQVFKVDFLTSIFVAIFRPSS